MTAFGDHAVDPQRALPGGEADSGMCADSGTRFRAIIPNFDGLAGLYRWMELATCGPWLARCRFAFLGDLGGAQNALILGDGDGRFAAGFLRANPLVRIRAIDASPAMLRALVRRAGPHAHRVTTEAADIRCWNPAADGQGGECCDLVVAHFFLDCFTTEEVFDLAGKIRPLLSTDARWVISEFALPTGRMGRVLGRLLISFLYRVFGILTGLPVRRLPDFEQALEQAGFVLVEGRAWLRGLLVSQMWAVDEGR